MDAIAQLQREVKNLQNRKVGLRYGTVMQAPTATLPLLVIFGSMWQVGDPVDPSAEGVVSNPRVLGGMKLKAGDHVTCLVRRNEFVILGGLGVGDGGGGGGGPYEPHTTALSKLGIMADDKADTLAGMSEAVQALLEGATTPDIRAAERDTSFWGPLVVYGHSINYTGSSDQSRGISNRLAEMLHTDVRHLAYAGSILSISGIAYGLGAGGYEQVYRNTRGTDNFNSGTTLPKNGPVWVLTGCNDKSIVDATPEKFKHALRAILSRFQYAQLWEDDETRTFTAHRESGSPTLTVAATQQVKRGQPISGTGIPAGTFVGDWDRYAQTVSLVDSAGAPVNASSSTPSMTVGTTTGGGGGNNEVQTITMPSGITGGTFTVTVGGGGAGNETVAIAYNAPATGTGSVQAALEGTTYLDPGDVSVVRSGTAPAYTWTITYQGARANTNVPQATVNDDGLVTNYAQTSLKYDANWAAQDQFATDTDSIGQPWKTSSHTYHSLPASGNVGHKVTCYVPGDFEGGHVALAFPCDDNGYGALWDIYVDGQLIGTHDSRNINVTSLGSFGYWNTSVFRCTNLEPGAHVIEADPRTINNTAYFDCFWTEAADPPLVQVCLQYETGTTIPGGTDAGGFDNLNTALTDVVAEFDPNVFLFDSEPVIQSDREGCMADGIHLSDKGGALVAAQAAANYVSKAQTVQHHARGQFHHAFLSKRPHSSIRNLVTAALPDTVPLSLQAAPSPVANTAHLQNWNNQIGTTLAWISKTGSFEASPPLIGTESPNPSLIPNSGQGAWVGGSDNLTIIGMGGTLDWAKASILFLSSGWAGVAFKQTGPGELTLKGAGSTDVGDLHITGDLTVDGGTSSTTSFTSGLGPVTGGVVNLSRQATADNIGATSPALADKISFFGASSAASRYGLGMAFAGIVEYGPVGTLLGVVQAGATGQRSDWFTGSALMGAYMNNQGNFVSVLDSSNPAYSAAQASAGHYLLRNTVSGHDRFRVDFDGLLEWFDSSGANVANLYRQGSNILQTDSTFRAFQLQVGPVLGTSFGLYNALGDANPLIGIGGSAAAGAYITFGGVGGGTATDSKIGWLATNKVGIQAGNQTTRFATMGGTLAQDMALASTPSNTTETDLTTYTIPGGTFSANGDEVYAHYVGEYGATGNNKTIQVYFDGTSIFDSGAMAANAQGWRVEVHLVRVTSTTARYWCFFSRGATGTGGSPTSFFSEGSVTVTNFTANRILKITGQNGTTGVSGEIVGKIAKLEYRPSAN